VGDPRIGFYGDDVTGSVDVLLQFARTGAQGRLFVGTPETSALVAAAAECSVVGIAGIARSLPTDQLEEEIAPALRALRAIDPDIVQYKACSTADSSPNFGSLGRVLEIGRDIFGAATVPMLFAQPDFGRYTVFGHHFAAEGDRIHRLDRQPTMANHPSTPMTESDLAVHLSHQTALPVGALHVTEYASASAIAQRVLDSRDAAVVLDALDDAHLALLGDALRRLARPLFMIGSGGLSRAIGLARTTDSIALTGSIRARGPVLVVSGSRSPQTRRQAAAAAAAGWVVRPLPSLVDDDAVADVVRVLRSERSLVLTSDDTTLDGDALAAIARSAASMITGAVQAGVTSRIIVCGGDTSSRVVRMLGIQSLSLAANPEGNVVLLRAHSDDPSIDGLEVLLKGGQVGADDLFVKIAGDRA